MGLCLGADCVERQCTIRTGESREQIAPTKDVAGVRMNVMDGRAE